MFWGCWHVLDTCDRRGRKGENLRVGEAEVGETRIQLTEKGKRQRDIPQTTEDSFSRAPFHATVVPQPITFSTVVADVACGDIS